MIGGVNRTRAVIAALSVIPVLLVAGCSDDEPKPKFDPTPSVSPTSPSTSPAGGSARPSLPADAQGTDTAAAEAFVEFYWQTVNYAQATGDVDALRRLGDDSCKACQGGVEYLEEVFAADGQISGGDGVVKIRESTLLPDGDVSEAVVKFTLTSTPQHVEYPGTEKDKDFPGGRTTMNALLAQTAAGWVMQSWGAQK